MRACFRCGTDASVGEVAIWNSRRWLWVWDASSLWFDRSNEWLKLPRIAWNQPVFSKIDASGIYCRSCWEEWGQHVKEGTYALSSSTEKLAVQAGIQWVNPSEASPQGNPFYCPPCGRFFCHDVHSLDKHLRESHPESTQHLACKRKHEETLASIDLAAPALQDSGRSTSQSVPDRTDGNRPAVRDERGLEIQSFDAADDCDTSYFPGDDGIWEFDASRHGEGENWQPMTRGMNDVLERRWDMGWDENPALSDFFYVNGNSCSYRIDSHCMIQQNQLTGRVRDIRRITGAADAAKVVRVEQLLQDRVPKSKAVFFGDHRLLISFVYTYIHIYIYTLICSPSSVTKASLFSPR